MEEVLGEIAIRSRTLQGDKTTITAIVSIILCPLSVPQPENKVSLEFQSPSTYFSLTLMIEIELILTLKSLEKHLILASLSANNNYQLTQECRATALTNSQIIKYPSRVQMLTNPTVARTLFLSKTN
jgi:hypothetical protein